MKFHLTRTMAGLAAGITVAVASAFAVGAYLYSDHYFNTLLAAARETALTQGELVREALEHQMMEKDRAFIAEMVRGFGGGAQVERLEVLDHQGRVRYSSGSGLPDSGEAEIIPRSSPACQTCHQHAPPERDLSAVLESGDRQILRVVVPIRNQPACQICHDAATAVNGIVILDRDVGEIQASLNRDLRWMVLGSAILAFVLVAVVLGIVQVLLLRRLKRIETTARLMAGGDLNRRVSVQGTDTISWLGREFNTMADSVTELLREVGKQKERLETVINSIDDGIVVLDPQRRVVAANKAFLDRAGLVREGIMGCGCGELTGGFCDTGDCPTLACLRTGEHQVRIFQRQEPSGSVAWEEIHSSPVRDASGEVFQVVEVWREISERRKAEARLAESHRLASLGMLASGFSHEMNTPLGTVLTCIESILREIRSQEDGGGATERIGETASVARDQILRCKGITQHFLRLSRGHSSPGEIVEMAEVVDGVVRLVGSTARARGVDLRVDPLPAGVRVRADERDLQHALMNLIINGIEACEPDGWVRIQLRNGTSVSILVTDNGRGIPRDKAESIFEPFVSLREGGTGLGLFLALNFVRRWGGSIRAAPRPEGGAVFEVELPGAEGIGTEGGPG